MADEPTSNGGDTAPGGERPPIALVDDDGWRRDSRGRQYAAGVGRSGIVYRQGNETVEEALARDTKGPKDTKPRAKKKPATPKKPPAPTQQSLKELESALTDALKAPALICITLGDEWPADHLMRHAPVVARRLVIASEHNPWLRAKLEAALRGEDFMMKLITTMSVGGAMVMYALPPVLFYVDLPFVSDQARDMLGVPERERRNKQQQEESGAGAPPPAAAAPAGAAAAA